MMSDDEAERFVWKMVKRSVDVAPYNVILPDVLESDINRVQSAWVRVYAKLDAHIRGDK